MICVLILAWKHHAFHVSIDLPVSPVTVYPSVYTIYTSRTAMANASKIFQACAGCMSRAPAFWGPKLYPLVTCYMYCMLLHNYEKSSLFQGFSNIYEGHMFHRKLSKFQRVLQLHHPKEKLQSIKIFLDTAWRPSDVSGANWRCHVYPKLLCYPHSPCLLLAKVKFTVVVWTWFPYWKDLPLCWIPRFIPADCVTMKAAWRHGNRVVWMNPARLSSHLGALH